MGIVLGITIVFTPFAKLHYLAVLLLGLVSYEVSLRPFPAAASPGGSPSSMRKSVDLSAAAAME